MKDNSAQHRYDLPTFITEPHEAYHARRSSHMSSHALADFRKSPLLFRKKRSGLIPQVTSDAYTVGGAAHCLILEGDRAFESRYHVGGPINPKTDRPYGSETKAYKEWAARQTKEVLSDDQYALCVQMRAGVRANPEAVRLLAEGQAEAVVRADYCGTPCQIRLDWISPVQGDGIVDLKTVYDVDEFEEQARKFGYIHQLAFYRELLALKMRGQRLPCWFIAVEKKEPYRCGVWEVCISSLEVARRDNEWAMQQFLACRDGNHWPTGCESIRTLTL